MMEARAEADVFGDFVRLRVRQKEPRLYAKAWDFECSVPVDHGTKIPDECITVLPIEAARQIHSAPGEALGVPKQSFLEGMVKAKEDNLSDLRKILERVQL